MKLVRQPKDSNLCGQACVATIACITLDQAVMLCGTSGRTRTRTLAEALKICHIDAGPGWKMGFPKSGNAILRYSDGQKSHWVVWWNGKYYDPAAGVFKWEPSWLKDARVTSHLRVGL